jgi:hypothetical protein
MKFHPESPFITANSQEPEIETAPITEREVWITVVERSHAFQGIFDVKLLFLDACAHMCAAVMTIM